jgi:hypothetical protein
MGAELFHAYRRTSRQDEANSRISQYSERTSKTLPVASLVLLLFNQRAANPARGAYFIPTLKTIGNIIVSVADQQRRHGCGGKI